MSIAEHHGLSCKAIAWTHDGPQLSTDEQHAFRYEVRGANGIIGFINTDRARSHPDVRWTTELLRDGKIEKIKGTYASVEQALTALQSRCSILIDLLIASDRRDRGDVKKVALLRGHRTELLNDAAG